jgi:DNA-binding response OmpR family regulator
MTRTTWDEAACCTGTAAAVAVGDWQFDRSLRRLFSASLAPVALSASEAELLWALVDHPGCVLTRDQLVALFRAPGVDVGERYVDLTIVRLRRKLGDSASSPRYIRTCRRQGYCYGPAKRD